MTFSIQHLQSLPWFRYVQAVLLFAIKTISVVTETHAGTALVAITNNSTVTHIPWSLEEKQYILSSYFWGYIILIIPGGLLCQTFRPKLVLTISCLLNSIIWIATPFLIHLGGWKVFCVLRAIQGISQSAVQSSIFASLSKLFTKCELPLIASLVSSGFEVGMVISTGVCGFIGSTSFNWPGIFYTFGIGTFIITIFWASLGFDGSLKKIDDNQPTIPWKQIITSPPFLSLLFVIGIQELGLTMTTLQIPIYFDHVFNVNINDNIFFSTIPQVMSLLMSWFLPFIAHVLIKLKTFSLIEVRKLYTIISVVIPVIVNIRLCLLKRSQLLEAEAMVVIAASSNGFHDIAYTTNIIDLSPNYVAILSSIMDLCTSLVQLIASLVLSQINVTN